MKKGEMAEGVISYVDFPGKGVILLKDEEKRVILNEGVEGQKVRYRVKKKEAKPLRSHLRRSDCFFSQRDKAACLQEFWCLRGLHLPASVL